MSEPPLVATDDDDLLEAVFRYQFAHNASHLKEEAAVYGLALRGDHEPSAEFLRRFADHRPPVAGASRCALTEAGDVADRETGAPALLFRVTEMRRLGPDEAEARGEYLEDRLSGAASVYRLAREDGRWVVKEDRMKWIS